MKLRFALVTVLLLAPLSAPAAQSRRPQFSDSASLRASFLAVFGNDFELVKDELKPRPDDNGRDVFWLAYVKPRGPGHFVLRYRFKPDDKHYSHVERQIYFTVAPRGCRRGPPSFGVYGRFCMGDTIVVPVIVSGAAGHSFELIKRAPASDEDWRTIDEKYADSRDRDLDKTPVENPSESLRYVGRRADKRHNRGLGYTLHLQAEFEAVKPGRFNLMVTSSAQSVKPRETPPGSKAIIVVDRGTPVTLIAGREEVRGFTMGHNGQEYESSTSGHGYMTNLIVLQPGDRISFTYLTVTRNGDFERRMNRRGIDAKDPAEEIEPVIGVRPFLLETRYDYSGWLVDYLP
jgi:hypothetical protein